MKLSCPFKNRFGLDVLHHPAADPALDEAIRDGTASAMMEDVLEECYAGGPDGPYRKLRKQILAIGLEGFSSAWFPGSDLDALLDFATFNGSMWITDDTFDDPKQDEAINASLVHVWCKIPALVDAIWKTTESKATGDAGTTKAMVKDLYDASMSRHKNLVVTGADPVIHCSNRMFVRAVVAARIKAGNDDVYQWFVTACRNWVTNSCSDNLGIRGKVNKDYRQFTAEQLRAWRSVNSGSVPAFSYAVAVHGVPIPQAVLDRPETARIFHIAGQHVGIVNDVFSYDREVNEEDGWANHVEFLRLSAGMDLDAAFSETVRVINGFTDEFIRLVDQVLLNTADGSTAGMMWYVSYLAARGMVGTIVWSLLVDRYSRKDYVRSILSNEEDSPGVEGAKIWRELATANGMHSGVPDTASGA